MARLRALGAVQFSALIGVADGVDQARSNTSALPRMRRRQKIGAVLGSDELGAAEHHRHPEREQRGGEQRTRLPGPERFDLGVVGRPFPDSRDPTPSRSTASDLVLTQGITLHDGTVRPR
jgi:hypothetical protein